LQELQYVMILQAIKRNFITRRASIAWLFFLQQ